MPFGDRVGIIGLIVAVLGVGITILWPKKVVGWVCIALAVVLCGWWGVLEIQSGRHPEVKQNSDASTKQSPVISWPKPSAIEYGVPLSARQLNATASTSGAFVYNPVLGATLPVGTDTLSVTFTPNDIDKYVAVTMTVPIVVKPTNATGELQSSIQVLQIIMRQGVQPQEPPLFTSVYYHNAGKLPTDEMAVFHNVLTSDNVIDESSIKLAQDRLLQNPRWDAAMLEAKGNELYSDRQASFFSIPNARGEEFDQLAQYLLSEAPSKQMVVVVAFRYRDKSMGEHMRNLTEGCGYFLGNSSTLHYCGRNRVIAESDFKRTSTAPRGSKPDPSHPQP